jgi:hypothetical protein
MKARWIIMRPKVQEALNCILQRFEAGDIPEAVSIVCFSKSDVPMNRWSLLNRLTVFLSGTRDARGIKQWNKVGRFPKKGSQAIYILAPALHKEKDNEGNERHVLEGFMAVPVFRYEDTDGKPIEYREPKLPDFPLIERAKEWGISIKALPGDRDYLGYYSEQRQEIVLATEAECVFFHELSHAAHAKVVGKLKGGQNPLQEIVAELSALSLCKLAGRDPKDYFGNSYRYISDYAEKLHMSAYGACVRVVSDVEKILNLILGGTA